MRSFVAFVFALVASLLWEPAAHACMNATLDDDPAYVRLRDAMERLDEGDVRGARERASPVAEGSVHAKYMPDVARERAERLVALSWIRDPAAPQARIESSIENLERIAKRQQVTSNTLQTEIGEAYARAGRDQEAYEHLQELADKDLIGSPYAWAAFARVAQKRGETAKADNARARCSQITTNAAICRGEYPSPPLLRGKTLGYALPGLLALVALVRRKRAKKPWSMYGDKIFAAIILATCAFVFAGARSPFGTTAVTLIVLVLAGITQRLAFVSAVKRGRIPNWTLRDATPEDGGLPALASVFHPAKTARVLERTPDASYREPARVPELRLVPRGRGTLAVAIAGFVLLALFSACATLTMRSTRSESASVYDSRLYME